VLFRASGVPDDDHWFWSAGGPAASDGDRRLIRGVGVCDRLIVAGWCLDDWVVERFRRNGDCNGLGVSLPPAERLRGGRVTRVAGGVPAPAAAVVTAAAAAVTVNKCAALIISARGEH